MGTIRKLFTLSSNQFVLLASVVWRLLRTELALRAAGVGGTVRQCPRRRQDRSRWRLFDIVRWIQAADQRLPFPGSCLRQSLVLWSFLPRETHATLNVGVRRNATTLEAHAWVESKGRILLGELPKGGFELLFHRTT